MSSRSKDTHAEDLDFFDETEPAAGSSKPDVDPVALLLQNKWRLVAACAAGMLLGYGAYLKLGPMYEATTRVMVSPKAAAQFNDSEPTTYGEPGEHLALIMSPMIVGSAVEHDGLSRLASLAGSTDPVQDILDGLTVKRSAGNDRSFINVLDVNYRNRRQADAIKIAGAIVGAYERYLAESHLEQRSQLLELIADAQEDLGRQLVEKERAYLEFRTHAPLLWKSPGATGAAATATNIHQENLRAIDQELRLNIIRRAEAKSKLATLDEALSDGRPREQLELLVRQFLSTPQSSTQAAGGATLGVPTGQAEFDARMLPLLVEEHKLLMDYGADHPDVQAIRNSMAAVREFYRQRGVTVPDPAAGGSDSISGYAQADFVSAYRQSLQHELISLDHRDEELRRLSAEETVKARELATFETQDQAMTAEIGRLKELWNGVVTRMRTMQLAEDQGGYTMERIAPVKGALVFKRVVKFVGAGAVGLSGLVLLLAYVQAWRDNSLRTLDDVRQSLGLAVLGTIPTFDPETVRHEGGTAGANLEPALQYYHQPASAIAESFRSARTALFVGAGARMEKVFQVTSPEPGDGKSTVTANLALAMAQAGKRVLLIDADMRRPNVHLLFGVSRGIGLADVLSGEVDLLTALRPTVAEGLSLLTAGTAEPNPSELLSSTRFARMMQQVRDEFDFVLVDTPPLLAVSDPSIVAQQVDAVALVVRMTKNNRAAALRALELVGASAARVIGVLINGYDSADVAAYGYQEEYTSYTPGNHECERENLRKRVHPMPSRSTSDAL